MNLHNLLIYNTYYILYLKLLYYYQQEYVGRY